MNENLQGQSLPTIDVHDKQELQWWAKELGVSEDQLRGAISQVGNSADAVRAALKTSRVSSANRAVPQSAGDDVIVSPMADAWARAQAAARSAHATPRSRAFARAVPWVLGAAAVAGLAFAANKWARPSGLAAACSAARNLFRKRVI